MAQNPAENRAEKLGFILCYGLFRAYLGPPLALRIVPLESPHLAVKVPRYLRSALRRRLPRVSAGTEILRRVLRRGGGHRRLEGA